MLMCRNGNEGNQIAGLEKKKTSSRLGQVDFLFGQVIFSPSLPNRQGPCRQAIHQLNF